jgi:colicin import membrane protein
MLRSQLAKMEIDTDAKLNAQQSLLAQREEQSMANKAELERHLAEAQYASVSRDAKDFAKKAENEARVCTLEAAVADRDAKIESILADKERALTAAAENHASAIGALNAEQRAAERATLEASAAEANKLRDEAAAAAKEAQREQYALREEAAAAAAAAAAQLRILQSETATQVAQLQVGPPHTAQYLEFLGTVNGTLMN